MRTARPAGPNIGSRVCLRFRRARDAELLRDYGMDGEVIETPSGDDRFRAFIPRNHLVTVLMNLGDRMAYPNFKDSIPEDDIARCKRLSPGMAVFGDLQVGGPYGAGQ